MNIHPLYDRIVVKGQEDQTPKSSLLTLPSTQEPSTIGEVVAVGPGITDDEGVFHPMSLNVGDRVLFGKHTGQPVKIGGVTYLSMREVDIVGIVLNT